MQRVASLRLSLEKIRREPAVSIEDSRGVVIRESLLLRVRLFEYSVLLEYFSVHIRR